MFDVERHHDEILVLSEHGFDCIHRDGVGRLVLTVSEARELTEKLMEATLPGTFEFVLTSSGVPDPEDG